MGYLLKCVTLYRTFTNIKETLHMLKRNSATTSLKIICKNVFSLKVYDKINMKVFASNL